MRYFMAISILLLTSACRTTTTPTEDSQIKSSQHMLNMQRVGEDYVITCLDGSKQSIPASKYETLSSADICPNVLASDCLPLIKYANGKILRQSSSTYNYPNGQPLRAGSGTIYYNTPTKQTFRTTTGVFYYASGKPLRSPSGVYYYKEGQELKSQGGVYRYANGQILKQPNGTIFYPNGDPLKTSDGGPRSFDGSLGSSQGTFYYLGNKIMKGNGNAFFYKDGTQARAGSILYRQDKEKSQSAVPLLLEEEISDQEKRLGTLRYAVDRTTDSFSLSLPTLTPEVGMNFEPKVGDFFMRFSLVENETLFNLDFDHKGVPLFYIIVSTGHPDERIVLSGKGNSNDVQCKAVRAIK